ncbi:hypothetical protein DEO72_LG3g859 [Vigna unguiculata]|uniref:Uncharacterized protein n=1 Tax=Vigna unguiculata TaxID=3917 RepID=A0A4D6LCU9_VIGUN|nr:hypothetical protein DEO72_LG3g859 [Vigna unguiculata]
MGFYGRRVLCLELLRPLRHSGRRGALTVGVWCCLAVVVLSFCIYVISEQGSYADASEHDDDADKEDVIRTQCWVDVVGEKNKGRLYGTRELGKGFTAGRGIHKQQPSSSNAEEAVN